MTKIFGVKGMTTVSSDEYKRSITEFATNASGKTAAKTPPKYLLSGPFEKDGYIFDIDGTQNYEQGQGSVEIDYDNVKKATLPPLILLHSAMILRPYAVKTNTTLQSTVTMTPNEGSTVLYGSGSSNQNKDKYTYEHSNMMFECENNKFLEKNTGTGSLTEIVRPPQIPNLRAVKASGNVRTAWSKTWRKAPLTEAEASALKAYDETMYAGMKEGIRQEIKSVFKLKKNQPFFIRARMHKMSEAQLGYASSSTFGKNDWMQFYPDEKAKHTAVEIEWGGKESDGTNDVFKLIIRADGQNGVELYKKDEKKDWAIVGSPECLPVVATGEESEAGYKEITIYPLGRDLIICAGIPSTQSTIEKRYLRWSFNRFVNIDESTVNVNFYGGETYFGFQPICHVQEGSLISPPVSCSFNVTANNSVEAGRFYLKVDYEGKFAHDHYGAVSSTEEIQLPLPTQEDEGTAGSGGGTVNMQKGGKQAKRGKKEPFFGYLGEFSSLSKQIHRNVGGQATDEDVSTFYDKAKNKGSVADNQFKYQVKLKARTGEGFNVGPTMSQGTSGLSATNRIYSPAVYKVELHVDPPIIRVDMRTNIPILNEHVKEVVLKQGVQSLGGTVVIWNRRSCDDRNGGIYTLSLSNPNNKGFSGVKPITISGGIINNISKQFSGYVTSRSYSRPSPAESYVTLELADASKRAREIMAVNLPIFDGWDHMCAMYYLGKECGFIDDQLLFYQNPRNENDKITLKQVIESGGGDCDTRQGGGWAGHVPKFPQSIGPASRVCKLPPSSIFACLPCNAFREQPAYMFQMGRPIWDCMNELRNFSGWYLFPNHFGNIVYSPAEAILGIQNSRAGQGSGGDFQRWTDAGGGNEDGHSLDMNYGAGVSASKTETPPKQVMEFGEVSGGKMGGAVDPLAFDQYQRNLSVTYGTDHVRNAVMAMSMIQSGEDPTNPVKYTPITVIEKQKGWPYNVDDPSYVPWPRWIIARSPYWNDLARLQSNTKQRLARAIMPRATPTFGAWGHAGLFPYDIVRLREDQADEVGVDGVQFVIQEVTKKWDGVSKLFSMDVSTEFVDFNVFEWTPHDNQGAGIQHSSG